MVEDNGLGAHGDWGRKEVQVGVEATDAKAEEPSLGRKTRQVALWTALSASPTLSALMEPEL